MKVATGFIQMFCNKKKDAILNESCESLHDFTMHSLVLPYNKCVKLIVESGIKQLVYYIDKFSTKNKKKSQMHLR